MKLSSRGLLLAIAITDHALASAQAAMDASDGFSVLLDRRATDLAAFPSPLMVESLPTYLSTQQADGSWPDVNYASGCDGRRANWPIQEHWNRVITLASAWSGRKSAFDLTLAGNETLLQGAKKGLKWWLARDYNSTDCMSQGGVSNSSCPCGTPGLWNTNWFGQYILVPTLASTACLTLREGLTSAELEGCIKILQRVYDRSATDIPGVGYLTGANLLNVMQESVSLGLLANNVTIINDALQRAYGGWVFSDEPSSDGVHRDGSFLQHSGILYNGNYGKDFLNAFIQLAGEAIGTEFAANASHHAPIAAQIRGSEWMIYVDQAIGQEHWDLNAIGRFVAFPTADLQASADINFNVDKLAAAVADFSGDDNVEDSIRRLRSNGSEPLLGNMGFFAADYTIHRRNGVILTNKLLSTRTVQTEAINSANPYGYHMGMGTLYSYVTGNEYKDIQNAWHWNLIPGTTTLLDLPALNMTTVATKGNRTFVGSVSDGWVGTSVMDFVDPKGSGLSFRKAWFFLDDSVVVVTQNITSNSSAPVVSVLDQRASANGSVKVDGETVETSAETRTYQGSTLFYGGNGYLSYDSPFNLTVADGTYSGNWSAISTSTVGVQNASIFSAYTTVADSSHAYAFFPASYEDRLRQESESPSSRIIRQGGITGVAGTERLSLVFWPDSAKTIDVGLDVIGWSDKGTMTVQTSAPIALLFAAKPRTSAGRKVVITVADPGQSLGSVNLVISYDDGSGRHGRRTFQVDLPQGGLAGSSTFLEMLIAY